MIVLLTTASFAYPLFWHADEVDRQTSINYAKFNSYDAFEEDDFNDFSKYNCISLKDYNTYANSNNYDSVDPITSRSSSKLIKKLRRDDYNYIASQDPYDGYDVDDFDSFSDMDCWTLSDYNNFAETKARDRWKPASLRDPEYFEKVISNVGTKRFHFFDYRDLYDLR